MALAQLASLESSHPWRLLLLGLLPLLILVVLRRHAAMSRTRRRLSAGCSALMALALMLLLADVRLPPRATVVFVIDRSLSIPEDVDASQPRVDRRAERIRQFIDEACAGHNGHHLAGIIVFGRQPLGASPTPLPVRYIESRDCDGSASDIAAALDLARSSFRADGAKRIVLFSDGNQDRGDAEAQARHARDQGVIIDVVPLLYHFDREILVQSVEVTTSTEPVKVVIRSMDADGVAGTLRVLRRNGERTESLEAEPRRVEVKHGSNTFTFAQAPPDGEPAALSYEAVFQPARRHPGRPQNKRATAHLLASPRQILVLEAKEGAQSYLVRHLRDGDPANRVIVDAMTPDKLPLRLAELALLLSGYRTIILADVPAAAFAPGHHEMLRHFTHDQGRGLIMIGGPSSFGAGRWQDTALEPALAVDCAPGERKCGLIVICHASRIGDRDHWMKMMARSIVRNLETGTFAGVIASDSWQFPPQELTDDRVGLLHKLEKMQIKSSLDVDTALRMASDVLSREKLGEKHIVVFSDGLRAPPGADVVKALDAEDICCSTISLATDEAVLGAWQHLGLVTGGRIQQLKRASIASEVTPFVSPFFQRGTAQPVANDRAVFKATLADELEPLHGFVRTKAKPQSVTAISVKPKANTKFPILAHWEYGLGRSAAFTTDVQADGWSRDWASAGVHGPFCRELVSWSLCPAKSDRLTLTAERRERTIHIDVVDDDHRPGLVVQGAVTVVPLQDRAVASIDLAFHPRSNGHNEASFPAEDAACYFVQVQARDSNGARESAGTCVTVSYPREFMETRTNIDLLRRLSDITGGTMFLEKARTLVDGNLVPDVTLIPDGALELEKVARSGMLFDTAGTAGKSLRFTWSALFVVAATGYATARWIHLDPVTALHNLGRKLRPEIAADAPAEDYIGRLMLAKFRVLLFLKKWKERLSGRP